MTKNLRCNFKKKPRNNWRKIEEIREKFKKYWSSK